MPERRKYPRSSVDLHVTFRPAESPNAAWKNSSRVVNLSRYGVFVETETILPVGTTLLLSIELPVQGRLVEVTGEVRWVSNNPENSGMGVQFYDEAPAALWDSIAGS